MTLKLTDDIAHIYTPHDIVESYGKEALIAYLDENQFEIQSRKVLSEVKTIQYSHRQLANIWDSILHGLLSNPSINLGQMIRNYHHSKNTKEQKDTIIKNLFHRALSTPMVVHGEEVYQEVVMLGMGMIFDDTLDWSNAESIVHITGHHVDEIINEPNILKG